MFLAPLAPQHPSPPTSAYPAAAGAEIGAVDLLPADLPLDDERGAQDERSGVTVPTNPLPRDAVAAIRDRPKRRKGNAAAPEPAPDAEVGVAVAGDAVNVTPVRLTVDRGDRPRTQDRAKPDG